MALCDCGRTAGRLRVRCESPDGKPLPQPWVSVCPECSPADFPAERIQAYDDKKLWLMQDAAPNEYEWSGGRKVLKDWARADVEDVISREDADDVANREKAIAKRRAYARERRMSQPALTPHQIQAIDEQIKSIRQRERAMAAGLVLPV